MATRKDQILAAALALADEAGLEAVTMRAVAARVGITPMALYRHVADKESLLDGVLETAVTGIGLPDLVSRLSMCTQAPLKPLDDAERRAVLRDRAEARGLALDDAVLDFLFNRYARDLGSLTVLLDRIDRASLAAKRRVTVPFLRGLLGSEGAAQD